MVKTNTLLPLALALAACVAAPSAFAQSTQAKTKATDAGRTEVPAAQAATPAVPATPAEPAQKADGTTEAQAATPATPAKKSWNELDANGNGTLSTTEAAPMESLSKVFAEADADANGELTQDEYKAWLAANGKDNGKPKPAQKPRG